MDQEQPKIPDELQQELVRAIQKLCVFIHDAAGMSHIMLDIHHVSDALARQGSTMISAAVGGVGVTRDPKKGEPMRDAKPVDAQAMVNDLVGQMMDAAKKKGADAPKADAPAQEPKKEGE
jgi:hypothetical protein